jgi:hypothetical protein
MILPKMKNNPNVPNHQPDDIAISVENTSTLPFTFINNGVKVK